MNPVRYVWNAGNLMALVTIPRIALVKMIQPQTDPVIDTLRRIADVIDTGGGFVSFTSSMSGYGSSKPVVNALKI